MFVLTASLILLLAVVVSDYIVRLLPFFVPIPLIQIALGAGLAAVFNVEIRLDPEIFFLLFLPPLLFADGWRISKTDLFKDKAVILELAVGLVVFTVLGVGLFVKWLIPSVPLSVAFALGAIISPTDPVAVSAIAAKTPIPKRLMRILEGEALLNDASGLVCMRFAVAATLTGTFSLIGATGTFLWMALGGIASGFLFTWYLMKLKNVATKYLGEDTGAQILLSLLTPFGAYIIAEHLQCSSILAAVASGITMSFAEQDGQIMAVTRVRRNIVWETVRFTANGVIFVILGEQLPYIVSRTLTTLPAAMRESQTQLFLYVLAVTGLLVLLRFFWVRVSLHFTLFKAKRRGEDMKTPPWRVVAAMSLAGVRGAITLAGVLTLPLVMPDRAPFPARDLMIFMASGVIICSLVLAGFGLPFLLKGLHLPQEPENQAEEEALVASARKAIEALKVVEKEKSVKSVADFELYTNVIAYVADLYQQRIDSHAKTGEEAKFSRRMSQIEHEVRIIALKAERDEVYRLGRRRSLPDDVVRKLVRAIDLAEARLLVSQEKSA